MNPFGAIGAFFLLFKMIFEATFLVIKLTIELIYHSSIILIRIISWLFKKLSKKNIKSN